MSRPLRVLAVGTAFVGTVVTALLTLLLPGTAAADVTVAASRAESGARNVTITFRVTNPDPAVPTTRLEVFLPTARPLLGVHPVAPAGWTVRVATAVPAVPKAVDGAAVAEVATAVAWEGGTVDGADYAVFPIDVDRLPDGAGPLRFRVVRTFADGATEEWSDLLPYDAPRPDHPALVVEYTAPTPSGPAAPVAVPHQHGHGGGEVGDGAVAAPDERAAGRFIALAVAVLALVVIVSHALGRWQRQRRARLDGRAGDRSGERAAAVSGSP